MKHSPALSLLLVFLLAACQLLPPPLVAPLQAEPPQGQQRQEEAASAYVAPELLDQELGHKHPARHRESPTKVEGGYQSNGGNSS
jgi:hypothetical protein